jgi:hypothetical protein
MLRHRLDETYKPRSFEVDYPHVQHLDADVQLADVEDEVVGLPVHQFLDAPAIVSAGADTLKFGLLFGLRCPEWPDGGGTAWIDPLKFRLLLGLR